jgi:hypothetical protein
MLSYEEWIKEEALKIKSDGCSKVPDFNKICCLEHDLAYHYGKDPKDAYHEGWEKAQKVKRGYPDAEFRRCNQEKSKLKIGSPLAAWRWVGVRLGGWNAWRKHRKERP